MESIKEVILFQDHHIVVVNKPAGMPVQADLTKDPNLLGLVQAYCKKDLHLANRIDRPVSGLVLLTKSTTASKSLQEQMAKSQFCKTYLAIVPINDLPDEGFIQNRVKKSEPSRKAWISDTEDGKMVKLQYRKRLKLEKYEILEVEITNGIFHQIRAQLAHAGIPLRGDVKYGARRANKDRSIGLHAFKIEFFHPTQNQKLEFESPIPMHDIWPEIAKRIP